MSRPIIRIVDVETGGDPIMDGDRIIEPGIIEIGFQDIVSARDDLLGNPIDWELGNYGWRLVNPGRPITPETSAIHNLVDADVSDAPAWGFVASRYFSDEMMDGVIAFAAHNIKTEQTLIGSELTRGLPWICTYKNAVRLWPDMVSHSNGSVRYHLNPAGLDRDRASPTHRAFPDAYVTAHILLEALKLASWADLAEWSTQPVLLPRCKIGKDYNNNGKGTPWAEVTTGMLEWILPRDFDEDVKHTVRYHLEQRQIDQRLEYECMELERQLRENGMAEQPARDTNTMELEF
jgi:exodeoxyribonuclease X